MDSLPLLPAVLVEAWAAPLVLEYLRCFTNTSGASAGVAGRVEGGLGLSLSLQSLSFCRAYLFPFLSM